MSSDRKKRNCGGVQYPTNKINPPVVTRPQSLPFNELTWENFEGLCLCLVEQTQNIEDARGYGVRGDFQEGIDIYAKLKNEATYITYQCKREKGFGPAEIKAAVSTFMKGSWFEKSQKFVICTQESLGSKKRSDEIERQRVRLQSSSKHIEFEAWDSNRLSRKLKDYPRIVEDFFDTGWADAFCGKTSGLKITNEQSECAVQRYKSWLTETTSYFEIPTIRQKFSISEDWISRKIAYSDDENVDLDVEVAAEIHQKFLLRGDSGSGKSTIMKRLCNSFSAIGRVVIYVYLPEVLRLYKSGERFEDAILSAATDGLNDDKNTLFSLLARPDYLLADGLDECQRGSVEIAKKLNDWVEGHSGTRVIVAYRSGIASESLFDWQEAKMQTLEKRDITNFSKSVIKKLISNQKQRDDAERVIEEILEDKAVFSLLQRSPIFVGFFIRLISMGKDFDYKNKAAIYKASIALAYEHLPQRDQTVEMDRHSALRVLEISGEKLLEIPETTVYQLIDYISDTLKSDGFTSKQARDTAEQGIQFWKEQRVLTQYYVGYESAVRFVHSSLCEYAAGQYATQLSENELRQWLNDLLSLDSSYQEAIFFASGLGAGEQIAQHLIASLDDSCDTLGMLSALLSKVISYSDEISEGTLKGFVLKVMKNLESSDFGIIFDCVSLLLRILPKGSNLIDETAKRYLGSNYYWSNVGAVIVILECDATKIDTKVLVDTVEGLISKESKSSERSISKTLLRGNESINPFWGCINKSDDYYLSSQAVLSICKHLLKYYVNDIDVISKVVEFLLNESFSSNELFYLKYKVQDKIAENLISSEKNFEWFSLLLKLRSQKSLFPDISKTCLRNQNAFQRSVKTRRSDRAFLQSIIRVVGSNENTESKKADSFLHMIALGQLIHGMKILIMLEKDWCNLHEGEDLEAFDIILKSMIAVLDISPHRLLSEATKALENVERFFSHDIESISKSFDADLHTWLSQFEKKTYEDIIFSTSLYGQVPKLPKIQIEWGNAKLLGLSPQILVRALEYPSRCISWNAALLIKHNAGGDEAIDLVKSRFGSDKWEAFKSNKSENPY